MLTRLSYFVVGLTLVAITTAGASEQDWFGILSETETGWGAICFGAQPGYSDGYDGQPAINHQGHAGIEIALYRTWGGSPAFYQRDFESPIPPGGSKTWSDIYLWSQNYTPTLGNRAYIAPSLDHPAPSGYWGRLTLDYVPESLGWAEPWEFIFPLDRFGVEGFYLPVPVTDNPYDPTQVTRMHLTVYAPVPEPSSLLALGMGGVGLLGMALRRRGSR